MSLELKSARGALAISNDYAAEIASNAGKAAVEDQFFTETVNDLVQGFSEEVAIVDADWTIIAVNDAWQQMVRVAGYPELVCGTNYRDFLTTFASKRHSPAIAVLNGVHEIDAGRREKFQLTYDGVNEWEGRTIELRVNRVHIDGRALATIARQDVTAAVELRRLQEQFSAAVLESQAEERRRFGRELHDSTAQLLTAAKLVVGTLLQRSATSDSLALLEELKELMSEAQQEVRSVSYLAHPPALQKMSFVPALKTLVKGFGDRSGLEASFQKKGRAVRLSRTVSSALYRIAQESLANVHRHAKATCVQVSVIFRKSMVHLVVADDGIGISNQTLAGAGRAGVGLMGMQSRLAEIGGRLRLRRLGCGTMVCASMPIRKKSA
ncbi:MAG TPA: histidine kinase [Sphingomicrobium sp.]|nr:histidine kinase [Sphingomicrobium sp.]